MLRESTSRRLGGRLLKGLLTAAPLIALFVALTTPAAKAYSVCEEGLGGCNWLFSECFRAGEYSDDCNCIHSVIAGYVCDGLTTIDP